ncbi:MAG: T9SS type A sorting domain-containing protein [Candidatus Kapabacteria bacterium]|jgi:hypothetical protein|nr:T9SS type A sorting domain-containing protein [Candidatus Kapabacteria bacterium]
MRTFGWFTLVISVIAFIVLSTHDSSAQNASAHQNRSSRGREFYIAFLPNVHDGGRNTTFLNDSLYIYITCDVPTSGNIRYRTRTGAETNVPFAITNPNEIFTFRVHFAGVELQGYYTGSAFDMLGAQSERVARQVFRVTANDDVTVYGLNQAQYTSDAFLALPASSLGKEYMVLAYKSDARGLLFMPNARDEVSTPSQFAVIATKNNTDIRIIPSAPTLVSGSTAAQIIRLNEGEVYLVQADPRVAGGLADLSGTRIIANEPIAVFAGHQRTTLPVELRPNLWTRDHLVEQLPGLETWGRTAFLTPLLRARDEIGIGSDLFRIIAAFDSTRVLVNGQPLVTLNAGQVFEGQLLSSAWITASDQILVAQYKKTSSTLEAKFIGDPFMLLVPQVEQYDRSYRFINVEAFDVQNLGQASPTSRGRVFEDHFITLIAPSGGTGLSSLRVDNTPLDVSRFTPIVNSGYSFANIAVSPGVHTARGDSAFGVYVYGYGVLNSYGYIGGGRLRIIAPDRDAPQLVAREECFGVSGMFYDTLLTDSRIASVRVLPAQTPIQQNVDVRIAAFTPFADSVAFQATLRNNRLDGEFTIEARDSIGFITRRRFFITGATVVLEGQNAQSPNVVESRLTLPTGASRIVRIPLVNYGTATQAITSVRLEMLQPNDTALLRFLGPNPVIRIPPGGRDTLLVGVNVPRDGRYSALVTLVVNDCRPYSPVRLVIDVGEDRTAPEIAANRDECARTVNFRLRDAEPFASGIATIEPAGALVNCVLRVSPGNALGELQAVLTIPNPNRDAIYAIAVTDSAGNRSEIRDTVQGFTLEIVRERNEAGETGRWGDVEISELDCRTITLRNQGLKPYSVPRLVPRGNVWFSVSESQLPLVVPPQSERRITMCFAPLEERSYLDSLVLEGYCQQQSLALTGRGIALFRIGTGRCNAVVRLRTNRASLQYFMEQNYPNPAVGISTSIQLGLMKQESVQLRIMTMLGAEVSNVNLGILPAGVHEIELETQALHAGTYLYVLETPSIRLAKQMVIVR